MAQCFVSALLSLVSGASTRRSMLWKMSLSLRDCSGGCAPAWSLCCSRTCCPHMDWTHSVHSPALTTYRKCRRCTTACTSVSVSVSPRGGRSEKHTHAFWEHDHLMFYTNRISGRTSGTACLKLHHLFIRTLSKCYFFPPFRYLYQLCFQSLATVLP